MEGHLVFILVKKLLTLIEVIVIIYEISIVCRSQGKSYMFL